MSLSYCWRCGVGFQTDDPLASTCPECREKESQHLADRLKEQVPVFRGIANRVREILRR